MHVLSSYSVYICLWTLHDRHSNNIKNLKIPKLINTYLAQVITKCLGLQFAYRGMH